MTRLILIRHGVTLWNKERRYCDSKDIGLTSEGKSQVRLLSKRLRAIKFDTVCCSDSVRAMQTARLLFKRREIIPDHDLREINFGIFEGLTHQEILKRHGDIYRKWLKDFFKTKIPRAETMKAFKARVERTISHIVHVNIAGTIAVVCHGGVIAIFVNGISKKRNFWHCIPSPASISIVDYVKGKYRLKKFNDIDHLAVNDE